LAIKMREVKEVFDIKITSQSIYTKYKNRYKTRIALLDVCRPLTQIALNKCNKHLFYQTHNTAYIFDGIRKNAFRRQ